jgi:hypothetical protein
MELDSLVTVPHSNATASFPVLYYSIEDAIDKSVTRKEHVRNDLP